MKTRRLPLWAQRQFILGDLVYRDGSPSEQLPYARFIDPETIQTRDGGVFQLIEIDGVPADTADRGDVEAWHHSRAEMLRILAGEGLWVHTTLQRRIDTRWPRARSAIAYAAALDDAYRARWSGSERFGNTYYLAIGLDPPPLKGLFAKRSEISPEMIARLRQKVQEVETQLTRYGARILRIERQGEKLAAPALDPLGWTLNRTWVEHHAPRADLASALPSARIEFAKDRIRWTLPDGRKFVGAMLGIREYPASTGVGMLDALLSMPCELVVAQSFVFTPPEFAIEEMNRQERRYELMQDAARSLQAQLVDARDDIASRRMAWGAHTMAVLVLAPTDALLDVHLRDAVSRIHTAGVVVVRETMNLEPAYWACFPANHGFAARVAGISTRNFTGFNAFHDTDTGKFAGNHWGEAATGLETAEGSPYWFSFHVKDVGHTAVVGATGSGKTVATCFLIAASLRAKPTPQLYVLDKDRSTEPFVRALGGNYRALKPGVPTGWNPFQIELTPANRVWLAQLISMMAAPQGDLDPKLAEAITFAVGQLADMDASLRTAQTVRSLIPSMDGSADQQTNLTAWLTASGEHHWVFGAETNQVPIDAPIVGLDMTAVMATPAVTQAALFWIFKLLDDAITGHPTLVYLEEAWLFLRHPSFARSLEDWLRTWRKRNAAVIAVMQSASDALASKVGQIIRENTPTHIFFPSTRSAEEDYVKGWGLPPHLYQTLRNAGTDSRRFLLRRGDVASLLRLDLGHLPQHLKVLSANAERLEVLDRLIREHGPDPAGWLREYMERAP